MATTAGRLNLSMASLRSGTWLATTSTNLDAMMMKLVVFAALVSLAAPAGQARSLRELEAFGPSPQHIAIDPCILYRLG